MPEHKGGERFTIELEALRDSVPPAVRLRRWLKSALRSARFRALTVRDTTPTLPPVAAGGASNTPEASVPSDATAE